MGGVRQVLRESRASALLKKHSQDGEYTALVSGKVGEGEFVVEWRFPLSAAQAYSSAIVMHMWREGL